MNYNYQDVVLNSEQSYSLDRKEIENRGGDSYSLMKQAANYVSYEAQKIIDKNSKIVVVCGLGNNAGDGILAGKYLSELGYNVSLYSVKGFNLLKGDALKAFAEAKICDINLLEELDESTISNYDLVIDAIFGIGLSRDLEGEFRDVVNLINSSKIKNKCKILSVDIASGVNANSGEIMGLAVNADVTVSFFGYKIGHLLLPGKDNSPITKIYDLSSNKADNINYKEFKIYVNKPSLWYDKLKVKSPYDHKYKAGSVVVNGSAKDSAGATCLSAQAAAKSGAGIVTVACDDNSLEIYASKFESIMNKVCHDDRDFLSLIKSKKADSILLGPGNGVGEALRKRVLATLSLKLPTILDADALTSFEDSPDDLFDKLHDKCILTPHEGEFNRLFSSISKNLNKIDKVLQASKVAGCVVILKGSDTVISDGDKVIINNNAPNKLATAGSGDVLSGIVAGLLSSGLNSLSAACAGVYFHSKSALNCDQENLVAEDLLDKLGGVAG